MVEPPAERRRGADLARQTFVRQIVVGAPANLLGAVVIFDFVAWVFPRTVTDEQARRLLLRGGLLAAGYLAVAFPVSIWLRWRRFGFLARWLREDRPASLAERREVLLQPLRFVTYSAPWWLGAAVLFGLFFGAESVAAGVHVGVVVILGGISTCAFGYLLSERAIRPITARALAAGPPEQPLAPGVSVRLITAWVLATGVPVLGMLALAVSYVAGGSLDTDRTLASVLFLAALTLAAGLTSIFVAARRWPNTSCAREPTWPVRRSR